MSEWYSQNVMESRTDICVIMWQLCEYAKMNGEKHFCLILVLLQKMTFIWDGRNPVRVTVSYSQETWHAHHVKRASSLSNKVDKQRYIYLLGDGVMTPTGTDPKPGQQCIMGAVHCSCRTDWNTRHCVCLYFLYRPMYQCDTWPMMGFR